MFVLFYFIFCNSFSLFLVIFYIFMYTYLYSIMLYHTTAALFASESDDTLLVIVACANSNVMCTYNCTPLTFLSPIPISYPSIHSDSTSPPSFYFIQMRITTTTLLMMMIILLLLLLLALLLMMLG